MSTPSGALAADGSRNSQSWTAAGMSWQFPFLTLLAWNLITTERDAKSAQYGWDGMWLRVERINLQSILHGVLLLLSCRSWLSWLSALLAFHIQTLLRHETLFNSVYLSASLERYKLKDRGAQSAKKVWGESPSRICGAGGDMQASWSGLLVP